MQTKHYLVLVGLLLISTILTAQSTRKILREANQLIDVELYNDAIKILEPLYEEEHPEATLLTGFSFLAHEEKLSKAVETLEKSADLYPLKEKNNSTEALEAHYYYGQALRMNEQAEKALEELQKLKKHASESEFSDLIEQEISYCRNFLKLKENPVDMRIEHLGEVLNSPYEDHSPVVLYDESTLYFTSNRPVDTTDVTTPDFENIFVSHWRNGEWTEPKILNIPGDQEANRATIGLTPDGQGLILFQNFGYSGALYISKKTIDGWSTPEPLPGPVNSGFNETHASFSPDENTIVFTSERPGGQGGKDIYFSNRLPDGTWGKPINPGDKINTSRDEESPFLHPNGKTLYFSSDGHNSIGGYDIFKSEKNENGEWSEAENIGYPINTTTDDVFYIPTPDGQRVYLSSRRKGSIGQSDLFLLHFPETDERSMAVVSSHVFNQDNQPAENAIIRVRNKTTNTQSGTYRVNPETGKFVAIIPTGQQYELTIDSEGHQTHKQTFKPGLKDDFKSKKRAVYLPAITLKAK